MVDFCDMGSLAECQFLNHALACVHCAQAGRGPEWIEGVPCCRECGEPIPTERLRVQPDAEACIDCATEAECRQPIAIRPEDSLPIRGRLR